MKTPHSGGRKPGGPHSPRPHGSSGGPARAAFGGKTARPGGPARAESPHGDKPNGDKPHAGGKRHTTHKNASSEAPRDAARPAGPRLSIATAPEAAATPAMRPARGGRPAAPAGTVWIYGLHPVAAALANPNRRTRRLLVTEEAEAALQAAVKAPFSLQPERTERARLDHLLGHDCVHQGAALLADPLPQPTLQALLERPGPILVLDQVTDPRNVGAILRSAAAFGAAGIITQERNAPDETGALAKAASGALEIVPMIRAVNLARTLVALKAADCWVVGLAAGTTILRGTAFAQRRVALVLGAEGEGMRRLTRETCDELAGLAMPGAMESLNVSAAATVALYELTRG